MKIIKISIPLSVILFASAYMKNIPPPNEKVACVIFGEAGKGYSKTARWIVASTIMNRRKHAGFGNGRLETMEQVAYQPKAYSCVGDEKNGNWTNPDKTCPEWQEALELSRGCFVPYPSIVYYHDRSVKKAPASWTNKWWEAKRRIISKDFTAYTIKARRTK